MGYKRVLIVEDESLVAFGFRSLLKMLGYDVVGIVRSGEDAIRMNDDLRPDLILMDIRLDGEIDGIEAAKRIGESNPTPIVYLTASSDAATMERAQATDHSGFIVKPVMIEEMRETISQALA